MTKFKSIKETLGKSFVISLLIPFYLIVLTGLVGMASYQQGELNKDQEELLTYGEKKVMGYEIDMASKTLMDEFHIIESGFVDVDLITKYMDDIDKSHQNLHEILILSKDGQVIHTNSEDSYMLGFDYSLNDAYLNATTSKVRWSSALLSQSSEDVTFNISYMSETGQVIIAKFTPKEFQSVVVDLAKKKVKEKWRFVLLTASSLPILIIIRFLNVQENCQWIHYLVLKGPVPHCIIKKS